MSEYDHFAQNPQAGPQSNNSPGTPQDGVDRRTWLTKQLESPAARYFWRRYKHTIIAMVIAVILAMMIMHIGFGYTLLTVFFLAIGFMVGGWRDGNPFVYNILRRFL